MSDETMKTDPARAPGAGETTRDAAMRVAADSQSVREASDAQSTREATDARSAREAADALSAHEDAAMAAVAEAGASAAPRDLDRAQARLAYTIIQTLLTHTTVTSDLVALMAQVLDRDTLEALTNTPHWAAYLDSRRALERAREQLEQFTQIMTRLDDDEVKETRRRADAQTRGRDEATAEDQGE